MPEWGVHVFVGCHSRLHARISLLEKLLGSLLFPAVVISSGGYFLRCILVFEENTCVKLSLLPRPALPTVLSRDGIKPLEEAPFGGIVEPVEFGIADCVSHGPIADIPHDVWDARRGRPDVVL